MFLYKVKSLELIRSHNCSCSAGIFGSGCGEARVDKAGVLAVGVAERLAILISGE